MNGHPALIGQSGRTRVTNDLCVASHSSLMHYALLDSKRLLHCERDYALRMDTPNKRLRAARKKKFSSATDAADALGIPRATYIGHENGHRGFPAVRAATYARRFKVTEEWLLYGKGDSDIPDLPTEAEIESMVKIALDAGVGPNTLSVDLPRIVAPVLRAQLERYQAAGGVLDFEGPANARGIASRSRAATTQDDQEELRTA
jgi:DNA-binding XRE family transcriptional regulator